MMSQWNGTIIGPGHVSISSLRRFCIIDLTVACRPLVSDCPREPHLQLEDYLWRELP